VGTRNGVDWQHEEAALSNEVAVFLRLPIYQPMPNAGHAWLQIRAFILIPDCCRLPYFTQ
jgi:hypothetical protein